MPKRTLICRVCGKPYTACRSVKAGSGPFNWREVACSPECGTLYFKQVMESRGLIEEPKGRKKAKPVHEAAQAEEHICEDPRGTPKE